MRNAAPTMALLREELNKPRLKAVCGKRIWWPISWTGKKMSKLPTGNSKVKVSKRTRWVAWALKANLQNTSKLWKSNNLRKLDKKYGNVVFYKKQMITNDILKELSTVEDQEKKGNYCWSLLILESTRLTVLIPASKEIASVFVGRDQQIILKRTMQRTAEDLIKFTSRAVVTETEKKFHVWSACLSGAMGGSSSMAKKKKTIQQYPGKAYV